MRYIILSISILLFSTAIKAEVTDTQYTDATNELKSIYEIINNRGMNCDAGLDAIGISAVQSEHCHDFMNSDTLIEKIPAQCKVLLKWTDENPMNNKDMSILIKTKFVADYCGQRPPAKYLYIGKVFKKIQLMGN